MRTAVAGERCTKLPVSFASFVSFFFIFLFLKILEKARISIPDSTGMTNLKIGRKRCVHEHTGHSLSHCVTTMGGAVVVTRLRETEL